MGVLVAVLVGSFACSVLAGGGNDGPEPPTDFEARAQCETWLLDQLRAPSTADFSDVEVTGGPASWEVEGSVDAENGFGAMLRSRWTCDIRLDGDTWRGRATLLE
ncbi:hypothetical protein N866_11165 [Actinotalea ferrariae CF5-4]|uniref:Lipoprotein n=1 Tax=Actinotalea ferrariae CF5-4 TaxID=948458 RepID=A0A021VSV9_9CELL|nr:hypothetical protein [Actinotalea ferrariae]EYR62157.1 hypothetical protein N866_11165 [Actinotalea ferrariae CF5-4]